MGKEKKVANFLNIFCNISNKSGINIYFLKFINKCPKDTCGGLGLEGPNKPT